MENNVSNEGTGKDPNNGFLHHKDRINPKQFGQNNESIFNFMDHTETINQLPCVEDANAIASNIPPVRQAPIRSSDQLQPAMELSLEGLKSLDQHPVREGRHSDAGDGVNGLPSGLIPGADPMAQGITSTSTTSVDEKAAPHGVQGGVADIAPVRLQVSETNKAPNSAIEVLVSQGRRSFEVVLKGGTPWGFALNGGPGTDLPLYISKIVTDGKASDSALLEGDYVLQINSVPCAEVGEALDIVDTATQTLALLVLRGQWSPPSPGPVPKASSSNNSKCHSLLQRAYDLQQQQQRSSKDKEKQQRPVSSDDSVVFAASRSSQQAAIRHSTAKRRGDSFNVGRLNHRRESPSSVKYRSGPPSSSPADRARSSSSSSFSLSPSSGQKHPPSPSPVWSSNEPRRSSSSATAGATVSLDLEPSQGRPPSRPSGERRSEQWTAVSREDMSRRRSDGYGLGGKSSRRGGQDNMHPFQHHQQQQQQQQQHYPLNGQQQRYAQQHPQQKHPKNQASLQLFSMKSSPNLAYPDRLETREYDPGGARPVQAPSSSLYKRNNSRSSPNIHADMNTPEISQQAYSKQPGPQQQQQQQQSQVPPDYMNMARSTPDLLISPGPGRHLSTTTFPCEDKASPHSKSSSSQAPLSASHGLHRYQADYENLSHLGTQPLGSEKISEISDIDEITGQDSLPTSPDPQRSSGKGHEHSERSPPHPLSNLKTYAENEPRNAAKMGSSNFVGSAPVGGPPTRDPMTLKYIKVNQSHEKYPSWPVTQPSGGAARGDQADTINSRAQSMTDHTNTSKEFPKKQRLAYTPGLRPLAERNSPTGGAEENGKTSRNASDPGFQKSEFVYDRMGRVQKSGHDAVDQRFEDFYKNSQPGYPPPAMDSDGHNIGDKEYSAPSPPERDAKAISERELSQHLAGFMSSDKEASAMPPNSNLATSESDYSRQEVAKVDSGTSPMEDPGSQSMHEDNVAPRPISHSKSERFRPSQVQYREGAMQPNIQRDRPSSYTASLSARESGFKPAGGNNKGVIVRSTPYYNTSTQTDMMPYAIKVSDPLVVASRLRNAQVQVNEVSPQTSPKSPQQQFEEKSIQARMSRDFQDPNVSERESSDHLKRWLRTGLGTDTTNPKQDAKQQVGKASSNDNYFNYPAVTSAANSTNYLLLSHQSSPFPGIKSIQAKYATDEGPNDTEDRTIPNTSVSSASIPGAADDHGSIRSAFSDNSASILRKLSEEFYGNRQQRMSSNSTATYSSTSSMSAGPDQKLHSPRLESAAQQPGLREAESYSSVVIHPDQSFGLFGRDDYVSSVSSLSGDSNKHDSSNYSDVSVGGTSYSSRLHQEKISRDAVGTSRSRRSLDPSYFSQKSRLQSQDPRVSSSTASLFGPRSQLYHHQRELSAPVSSTSSLSLSQSPHSLPQSSTTAPGSNKARPHDLSIISDSSLGSNPKSSSSEARSSQSTSNAASPSATQLGSLPNAEEAQGTTISNMRPFSASSAASAQSDEALKRLSSRRGSDSVFVGDDDLSDDYQFNRKPSMRKAYGIYDETERLISMSSKLPDKGKTNSASVASVSSGSTSGLSDHQAPASSRSHAFTVGLGLIREEGGDSSSDGKTAAVPPAGGERGAEQKNEPPQKYAWQNEAWLRSRIDLPKGSNLKRTTSEQIGVLKVGEDSNAHQTTYSNYENSRMLLGRPGASGSQHGRTQSGDFTNLGREAELKRMQQQAVLSFYQRKTTASTPSPSDHSRQFPGKAGYTSAGAPGAVSQSLSSLSYSPDSSLYESIGGKSSGGGSPTESVADIISKANENLAKSAQRVDSIRRSNSTTKSYSSAGFGFSAEYMDMAARHERMRKETDWSRLRSSGSLRYSPESSSTDPRRSNRSSFASENHYEDISMFAPSTPRGSVSESVPDSGFSGGASMDSGVVTSSGSQATYQNLPPAKRRPPPPPPPGGQDSSPDGPPPALPPRRYREPAETTPVMTNNISSNKLGESQGFEPSPESPASSSNPSQPTSSPRESSSTATADKHNRIHVIPLSRQQHQQDGGGDQSEIPKRDFKSLRSQWENNSPREDRYAAELRKQAHKFSHSQQPQQQQQQQQQPNPMPMAFKHSRTPINFSTTYKREPALPQEATSPASCSSPSLSESTTISSTSSSTHAQLQQQHPGLPSVSAAPNAGQHFSSIASSTPSSLSPPSSSSSSSATLRASTTTNPTEPSSSGDDHSKQTVSSPPPPQLPERTFGVKHQQQQHQQYHHQQQHDAGRFRSSSDASPTPSSASSGGGSAQPASGRYNSASAATISPNSRNHGAPDHETLSDQRHSQKIVSNNQSFSPTTAPHPHHSSVEGTQWRPLRTPEVPPPPQQLQGQQLSDDSMSAEFPPPPPEAMQDNPEEFAEDSYIGHKNKSSRPIGTYQRSKSAAVLPTSGAVSTSNSSISGSGSSSNISGVGAGLHTRSVSTADSTGLGAGVSVGADGVDESPGVFPSSRLAHQQGWTSEIVLSSATGAVDPGLGGGPGESSPPSSLLSPSGRNFDQPPARPARPNVQHARFDSGGSGGFGDQTTVSSIPVSSTVNTAAGPADSTLSSVSPSSYHRDNVNSNVPRRQPPPLPNSPAYDGHRQTPGGVAASSDNSVLPGQSQFWPKPGAAGASDLSSPQRRPYSGSLKDKQWMSQDTGSHRFPATPSPSSSQANPTSSTSSPPRSPGEVGAPPLTLPPKDYYRRRDSAPARPPNNSVNTSTPESPSNSKLQPPHDPPERRQSDSTPPNITATGNSVSTNSRSVSLHTVSLSPSHSRQPSQEELECDQKALMLAQHLAGQGADHQKLSEVLRSDTNKKRMQFMDGLFSQSLSSAPNSSLDGSLPSTNKAAISSPSSSTSSPGGSSVAPAAGSSPYGSSAPTSVSPAGYGATASGNGVFSRALAQNGSSTPDAHSDHNQRGKTLPKEYWMSPSKAALEMEWRRNEGLTKELTRDISDSGSLVKQKEELLEKLHKKLEILKEGKISLQQEIADNDLLGTQVRTQVEARCQSRAERDKFTSFLEDLEKIVRLLLNLSGQLARAENAVQALAPEVDGKLRKLTLDKRERLYAKHEEAKLLKDDLDKRGEQVTAMLKERLSPEQLGDYVHYVRTRSQLTIDLQEMEDKITLGGEQIQALRKSIPDTPAMDTHGTPRSDTTDPSPS